MLPFTVDKFLYPHETLKNKRYFSRVHSTRQNWIRKTISRFSSAICRLFIIKASSPAVFETKRIGSKAPFILRSEGNRKMFANPQKQPSRKSHDLNFPTVALKNLSQNNTRLSIQFLHKNHKPFNEPQHKNLTKRTSFVGKIP